MTEFTALLENARNYFNENYALCGVIFVVVALLLRGKRKAAVIVAACAVLLYSAYTYLSQIPI
jgi:hypothetical protein